MFGDFNFLPGGQVFRDRRIRHGAIVPAGRAERVGRICFDQPVAHVVLGIGAKTVQLVFERERAPIVALRLERGKCLRLRNIAEAMTAFFALIIFEIEKLRTMLTSEKLHGPSSIGLKRVKDSRIEITTPKHKKSPPAE